MNKEQYISDLYRQNTELHDEAEEISQARHKRVTQMQEEDTRDAARLDEIGRELVKNKAARDGASAITEV